MQVPTLGFSVAAVDALMPLHLRLDPAGIIAHVGPLVAKIRAREALVGQPFLDAFEVLRPAQTTTMRDLSRAIGIPVRLRLQSSPHTTFKGQIVALPDDGLLVNLSLGIAVAETVAQYDLTLADFAPTDLTIEMLYLLEAKSAAMSASRELNTRLQGAKIAAEEQAFTDTLTGLKNRRALGHVLDRLIEGGERFGLMHIDLDYFKEINDTHGHAAGDYVLQAAARKMVAITRADDVVARVGGDEFVIVFRGTTNTKVLNGIADRLIEELERPTTFEGKPCRISGSIGITVSALYDGPSAEVMLKDADVALYASKRRGRAQCTVYAPTLMT